MWWVPIATAIATYAANRQAEDRAREDAYGERVRQEKYAKTEAARQKAFAQEGIQWKVRDAQEAGISPLVALGASTHSASPIGIGQVHDDSAQYRSAQGQDISRAIQATMTKDDRDYQGLMMTENLRNARLKNSLLESQISLMNKPQNPPFPNQAGYSMDGQSASPSNTPYLSPKPAEPVIGAQLNPARDSGAINSYSYMKTDSGGLVVVPSKDAKERTEDDLAQQIQWALRNQLAPSVSGLKPPSVKEFPLSEAQRRQGFDRWVWHPLKQQFVPGRARNERGLWSPF